MNRRWLTILGGLITVVCLYIAFRGIHYAEILTVLRTVEYWWAAPVFGATVFSIWLRAIRWKLMLRPVKEVGISQSYTATMIGFMANNLLPMRLGELVRAYSLGRSAGVSKSSAFATIVVERAFDLLVLLLFLGISLLKYRFETWVHFTGYVALAICVGMFLVMVLFRWKRSLLVGAIAGLTRRFPEPLGEKAQGLANRFLDGLEVLARGHHLVWITLLSIAVWLAMAMSFYFTTMAFDLDLPLDSSIVMAVVCALAVMLPSGPGFIGTFEVGAKHGLMLFDVSDSTAVSYALFYHAVQFVPLTLLGLYHLWRQNFSLRKAVEEGEDGEGGEGGDEEGGGG